MHACHNDGQSRRTGHPSSSPECAHATLVAAISRLGIASATIVDIQCLGMASASSVAFHAWAWPGRPLAEEPQWARRFELMKSLIEMISALVAAIPFLPVHVHTPP